MTDERRFNSWAEPLDAQAIEERGRAVWESDTMCEGCGADPRANDGDAIDDPRWSIDTILMPNAQCPGDYITLSIIRCPQCW